MQIFVPFSTTVPFPIGRREVHRLHRQRVESDVDRGARERRAVRVLDATGPARPGFELDRHGRVGG